MDCLYFARRSASVFLAILVSLPAIAIDAARLSDVEGALIADEYDEFLGIGGTFGRWENGVVPITYNHAGAPSHVTQTDFEAQIVSSFSILEHIAGVKFDYRGASDTNIENTIDNLVVIAWEELPAGIAGSAGPWFGLGVLRLGYYPYADGVVRLNKTTNRGDFTRIILHELMHLLGLGHSENPQSIMNTSQSFFERPQQDDIDALQAIYGPPDSFVRPNVTIDLSAEAQRRDLVVIPEQSGFYLRKGNAGLNDISLITSIDGSFENDDEIFYKVRYQGGANNANFLEFYTTDPAGNNSLTDNKKLQLFNGIEYGFVGFGSNFLLNPGRWMVHVGMDNGLLTRDQIEVDAGSQVFNRTPEAQLSVSSNGNGSFGLSLTTSDAEGDAITINWHVPGKLPVTNGPASISVEVDTVAPVQIFAEVIDDGVRQGVPGRAGRGFGALESRYLVTPAEPNIPTYFSESGVFHIPSLAIGSDVQSMNFMMTASEGVILKQLSTDALTDFSGQAGAVLDLTQNTITIPRLIVNTAGVLTEFTNLDFVYVMGSSPMTLELLP